MEWLYWLLGVAGVVVVVFLVWGAVLTLNQASMEKSALPSFFSQREQLEAQFFHAASQSGKPRGLRWKSCDWDDKGVVFAREVKTGKLNALVAVTIHFEAIEGGDMEGVAAVGLPRNASAVFFHDKGCWRTSGKAVFNLNPGEAMEHFKGQYERVEKS
jgi:hypothetical protein